MPVDQSDRAPEPLLPDTWTVKEVVADLKADLVSHLDRQDSTLAEISTKVDSKADRADVQALSIKFENKFDGHERRLITLEDHKIDNEASSKFRRRAWTVVGTVVGVFAILGGSLIAAFVH